MFSTQNPQILLNLIITLRLIPLICPIPSLLSTFPIIVFQTTLALKEPKDNPRLVIGRQLTLEPNSEASLKTLVTLSTRANLVLLKSTLRLETVSKQRTQSIYSSKRGFDSQNIIGSLPKRR